MEFVHIHYNQLGNHWLELIDHWLNYLPAIQPAQIDYQNNYSKLFKQQQHAYRLSSGDVLSIQLWAYPEIPADSTCKLGCSCFNKYSAIGLLQILPTQTTKIF